MTTNQALKVPVLGIFRVGITKSIVTLVPSGFSMATRCSQKKQKYNACSHTVIEYNYCGGHPNTYNQKQICAERPGIYPPPTTEKPPALEGYCSRSCKAENRDWHIVVNGLQNPTSEATGTLKLTTWRT